MTWNIFRTKANRDLPRSSSASAKRPSGRQRSESLALSSSSESSHGRRRSHATIPSPHSTAVMTERPRLDPESNPLGGITTISSAKPTLGPSTLPKSSTDSEITRQGGTLMSERKVIHGSAKLGPCLVPKNRTDETSNILPNQRTRDNACINELIAVDDNANENVDRTGLDTIAASTEGAIKIVSSSQSIRSVSSSRSMRSIGATGTRSIRSNGHGSFRSRHIKAAHAAKRASSKYVAAYRGKPLICYTCGSEIFEIRCQSCQTAYVPPEFKFSASSAALFGLPNDGFNHTLPASSKPLSKKTSNTSGNSAKSISEVSVSEASVSGTSVSGATVFLGFYPEVDDEPDLTSTLDLELIADLARSNEAGLLEAVLFECFCNVDAITQAFCRRDGGLDHNDDNENEERILGNQQSPQRPVSSVYVDRADTGEASENQQISLSESIVDSVSVKKMYDVLSTVTSTAPIRGILQGAQAVLQTRRHEPISEEELAYIIIVLQCPAITDCSMFTKITGPMQKLSRYASLRSRARVILEVCSGLISHASEEFQRTFMQVFADLEKSKLEELVDLCNGYISHRLSFDYHYKSGSSVRPSEFQLVKHDWYADDWRIVVVVKLMALLWGANSLFSKDSSGLPISRFYNTMVDLVDLRADFDSWQAKTTRTRPRFSFCRYPFLLSAGSKSKILTHAIQREVNLAIQKELFESLANPSISHTEASQQAQLVKLRTFNIKIRRQHLFEDSMQQLMKWPNRKRRALRVEFYGEPGIDAGGLKKEWFLMFYRGFFDPKLDIFKLDESSNYCWFSRTADLDYCRVAGTTLGLALFNSITIDFNLPLLLFKLLLDAPYDLDDIATLWPDIAQSFQSILDYDEPDFEEAFGLTFTAPDGTPLIPDGNQINVTSTGRDTYVNLMVDYFVNPRGSPFQAFRDAFLDVCGGNAMTLFQPEELELLVHGDRQPFDVATLRSVTKYVNFGHRYDRANREPVVQWFWDYFQKLEPTSQGRLLQFITATDRPPAAGMVQMRFTIMCLGEDSERLPIAHTCFNQLGLYKYKSRQKLERKLSLAIEEYQGFGLK